MPYEPKPSKNTGAETAKSRPKKKSHDGFCKLADLIDEDMCFYFKGFQDCACLSLARAPAIATTVSSIAIAEFEENNGIASIVWL